MPNKIFALVCLLAAVPLSAFAATKEDALRALRGGNYDDALAQFQELQVAEPENPEILYGLGCVQYQRGLSRREANQAEEAKAAFQEAQAAFNGVLAGSGEHLHADAGFNLANVITQEAETAPAEDPKAQIAKWREAVAAYERVLAGAPSHEGARHNLDYARYKLKQLLQQPEEEKQDEQKPDEQPPQQIMTIFQSANTDIPGAQAIPSENTVELVQPGKGKKGGGQ